MKNSVQKNCDQTNLKQKLNWSKGNIENMEEETGIKEDGMKQTKWHRGENLLKVEKERGMNLKNIRTVIMNSFSIK